MIRVFMLGWEYPPHISGGLGTACEGLTTALGRTGRVEIDFVVPRLYGDEAAPHMRLLAPEAPRGPAPVREAAIAVERVDGEDVRVLAGEASHVTLFGVRSPLHPYLTPEAYAEVLAYVQGRAWVRERWSAERLTAADRLAFQHLPPEAAPAGGGHYGPNLFAEVARYARRVSRLAATRAFDVIHAHDWMTFPAAVAVKRATGKALVVHAHSLEYDRSGDHPDGRIYDVEKAGFEAADRIVAVSHYTRGQIHQRYGVALEKIGVVHNGVTPRRPEAARRERGKWHAKVVLYLGRVTFQKGPDYFVEAAAKVLRRMPDVTFVMAGAGDMLPRMIERVAELGLTRNFHFTGFLRGAELERMFAMADLYVMPSVSEPFGISPLEAMSYDVPVIISRQSGVSEVLRHALKVDFWDVDELANQIAGVLRYPGLRSDIVAFAGEELKRLRWDTAAETLLHQYQQVLHA